MSTIKKAKERGDRVLLQVKVPRTLRDSFRAACTAEQLTISSVLRAFMRETIDRRTNKTNGATTK